jgi:hypothetical protein
VKENVNKSGNSEDQSNNITDESPEIAKIRMQHLNKKD